ncbi:hypothetical protein FAGAP_2158 [Fusarium agapanthi]|uniref:Zn(2)-C6 fungal-type domain-containing protein n=1 Tax=Fusarium agapanthi TaxID=1803897 RepID=A0A9P5EG40_9HYPO|nr:hypothetical protein FAGAP_2158 [Fusarium agapanthi]
MVNAPGRPSKACDVCKRQKIRCSGERPSCKRCSRLNNTCQYETSRTQSRTTRAVGKSAAADATPRLVQSRHAAPAFLNKEPASNHDFYQGIAPSLVNTLVELYFENVYQSTLLLHKATFLQSLVDQTVKPHIVLSVCAWGANFYRNEAGKATLKEQGLMTKWAKEAGGLVFQDAEDLSDDNLVTFCNLSLFWHSQGSWRISYLHKGSACQLLHINGTGPKNGSSLEAELRRRRFWVCYLFHCLSCEKLFRFEAIADIENVPLPWPEEDLTVGSSRSAIATIANGVRSGSIFAELIRGLHLWSSVVSVVRSDGHLNPRPQEIFRVENNISSWWNNAPAAFKLDTSTISNIPRKDLPKMILTNLVYHQSLCALHSSIVPLFCWSKGDKTYSSARQLSGQIAFDHAIGISSLISAILNTGHPLRYVKLLEASWITGECRHLIDMLSLRPTREQQLYVRCLHDVHKRNPPVVAGEPKYMDFSALTNSDVDASLAKSSILQFAGMLRSDEGGYVRAGDETSDPTINTAASGGNVLADLEASDHAPNTIILQTPRQLNTGSSEWPALDIFNSLIDADMAGLFPVDENFDLSFLDADQTSWDLGFSLSYDKSS